MAKESGKKNALTALLNPSHGPIIITGNSVRIEIPKPVFSNNDGYAPDGANRYISPDHQRIVSGVIIDLDGRIPHQPVVFPLDGLCALLIHCGLEGAEEKIIRIRRHADALVRVDFDFKAFPLQPSNGQHLHYSPGRIIRRVELVDDAGAALSRYQVPASGRCEIFWQVGHA